MALLTRCDRCNKEVPISSAHDNIKFPVLGTDSILSDKKGLDFCFECLKSLWDWLRQGQNDAQRLVRK